MKSNLDNVLIRKAKKEDLNKIRELMRKVLYEGGRIPFAKHILKQLHVQVKYRKAINSLNFLTIYRLKMSTVHL